MEVSAAAIHMNEATVSAAQRETGHSFVLGIGMNPKAG